MTVIHFQSEPLLKQTFHLISIQFLLKIKNMFLSEYKSSEQNIVNDNNLSILLSIKHFKFFQFFIFLIVFLLYYIRQC